MPRFFRSSCRGRFVQRRPKRPPYPEVTQIQSRTNWHFRDEVLTSLHSSAGSGCIRPRSPSASASDSSSLSRRRRSPSITWRFLVAGSFTCSWLIAACPADRLVPARPKKYPREALPSTTATKSGTTELVVQQTLDTRTFQCGYFTLH